MKRLELGERKFCTARRHAGGVGKDAIVYCSSCGAGRCREHLDEPFLNDCCAGASRSQFMQVMQ